MPFALAAIDRSTPRYACRRLRDEWSGKFADVLGEIESTTFERLRARLSKQLRIQEPARVPAQRISSFGISVTSLWHRASTLAAKPASAIGRHDEGLSFRS